MSEAPGVMANRLGLHRRDKAGRGLGSSNLTFDDLLDLAVAAYWRNRPQPAKKGAAA